MGKLYGNPPIDLGYTKLDTSEMMFWMYLPIKVPYGDITLPDNLLQFKPLIQVVKSDLLGDEKNAYMYSNCFMYITAKTLFVTPDNPGNRPGWHSDGYMTNDLNYIWYDDNPTLFWEPSDLIEFTQDDRVSLMEMQEVERDTSHHRTYPCRRVLRLDETVIHRVANVTTPGVRTFVKISISPDKYNLRGNSVNHKLNLNWSYVPRLIERNQPHM